MTFMVLCPIWKRMNMKLDLTQLNMDTLDYDELFDDEDEHQEAA